jgi:hypothetical protein
MQQGDKVTLASFEGGKITPLEGTFVSMDGETVIVAVNGKEHKFRRAPGPKSGWGWGHASKWRLGLTERSALCIADTRSR